MERRNAVRKLTASTVYRAISENSQDEFSVFFEQIKVFLANYRPLIITSSMSIGNDDRWMNANLGIFMHAWFDHTYILDIRWQQKNSETFLNNVREIIDDLPKERVCAMIGMTPQNNEYHAYILYRDRTGEEVYIYNGRGERLHVECGVTMSPIKCAIQDKQEKFYKEGLGMCLPAMCFLAMIHKRFPSLTMNDIVLKLCDSPYNEKLDDIMKRFNMFLNTYPPFGVNEMNDEFYKLFKVPSVKV